MKEEWVNITVAVARLKTEGYQKVYPNKISQLARRGRIQTKEDPLDERARLVELNELRKLFATRLQSSNGNTALDSDDENDEP